MNIFEAIRSGSLSNVESLIEQDPNCVHDADPRGFTPLVLSTYLGFVEIAQFIIHAGADVNRQDKVGNTALMGVCFKGNIDMIKMLLDSGASVNITNQNNSNALIFAVSFGQEAAAKLLIEHKADGTQVDKSGRTALDYAREKKLGQIEGLLEAMSSSSL